MLKQKDWGKTDLTVYSGVSREMIGKYERGDTAPLIDAAKKKDVFEAPMDYLGTEVLMASFDKKISSVAGY